MKYYMLDKNKNVIETTAEEANNFFGIKNRRVAKDIINNKLISTVFLFIDYSYPEDDPNNPLVFETMIKNLETKEWLDYQERYHTWNEAEKGHDNAIQWVKDGCIYG